MTDKQNITTDLDLDEEFAKLIAISSRNAIVQGWLAQRAVEIEMSLRFFDSEALVLTQENGTYLGIHADGTVSELIPEGSTLKPPSQ